MESSNKSQKRYGGSTIGGKSNIFGRIGEERDSENGSVSGTSNASSSNILPTSNKAGGGGSQSGSDGPFPAQTSSSLSGKGGRITSFVRPIDQRKQERLRGAGTHIVAPQNVKFPSPSIGSSSVGTMQSNKSYTPTFSFAKLYQRGQEQSRQVIAPQPNTVVGRMTSSSSLGGGVPEIDQRKQERMRGAGKYVIQEQQISFPEQSPASSINTVTATEIASDSPSSVIPNPDQRKQERMRGAGNFPIQSKQITFPEQSPASSSIQPTSEITSETPFAIPALIQRKQERMRGAGSHAIQSKQISFPEQSPTSSVQPMSELAGQTSELASESSFAVPAIIQRKQERMRGAGNQPIQLQRIPFPDQSPASTVNAITSDLASEPSFIAPALEQRKQERMRGAGKHSIQLQRIAFPDQSPATTINAATSDMPSDPSFIAPALDQRKQERMRGAGIHSIKPHQINFPEQSPASTIIPASERSSVFPELLQRKQERMRGAGTHSIAPQQISFPEQSPISTIYAINDSTQIDPALMDSTTNAGYQFHHDTFEDGDQFDDTLVDDTVTLKRKSGRRESEMEHSRIGKRIREGRYESMPVLPQIVIDGPRALKHPIPFWQVPRIRLTKEHRLEAGRRLADLMELVTTARERQRTTQVNLNDADVIFTTIKREFEKVISKMNDRDANEIESFSQILLKNLVKIFRKLSEQQTKRTQLIRNLKIVKTKKIQMRILAHDQRTKVIRILRSIDGLRLQQQRKIEKSKNDEKIVNFLTDLRQTYSPLWN